MSSKSRWAKLTYILKLSAVYILTLAFGWYCIRPYHQIISVNVASRVTQPSSSLAIKTVSGQPVRLVIPASSIDIPLNPGAFNPSTDSWSLSGYYGQFDVDSSPANNSAGDTFIYGHNNDFVFGPLRHVTPASGALAYVYTNNGHIFQYSFSKTYSLGPTNTTVLVYSGPPTLTVQTCTGSLNEWRTMFIFNFDKVLS